MAIEFNCPNCFEPYKLKDEFAGKRATCKNPNCRQVLVIPKPVTVPEEKMRSAAELEAAALSALNDEPVKQEKLPAEQAIQMTCAICEHKWTEPFSKAGKNTLCPNPECRHRIKIPEPKTAEAVDWRQTKTKLPSGAKQNFEKLEGVEDAAEAKIVSGASLREADATGIEFEPRALKEKAKITLMVLVPLALVVFGIIYLTRSTVEKGDDKLIAAAHKGLEESSKDLSPNEASLCSAVLNTASGEYALGRNKPEKLKEAHDRFVQARKDLGKVPPGPEMYWVAAELVIAVIALGGTDEQVKEQVRIRWVPNISGGKLKINERVFTVYDELRQVLELLGTADFDFRIILTRRLTRDLFKKGQPGLAADIIPIVLFTDVERDEARAVLALELYRLDNSSDLARKIAEELKAKIAGELNTKAGGTGIRSSPFPASACTLFVIVLKDNIPKFLDPPKPNTNPSDPVRIAYCGIRILENNPDEAVKLAARPDSVRSQLRALVLCAEWTASPAPALEEAQRIIAAEKNKKPPTLLQSQFQILRLSQIAAAAGWAEPARTLADSLTDEGMKAWALGDAVHLRFTTSNKEKADATALELPEDEKRLKVGHAWGFYWIARHNEFLSGDRAEETKAISAWPAPIRPFGLAGIALGRQER